MSIPIVEASSEDGTLYSPFSGQRAHDENGPNTADPSLLLYFCGDAGSYGHASATVIDQLDAGSVDDLGPIDEVLSSLSVPGAFAIRLDMGWNGVDTYVFAPHAS